MPVGRQPQSRLQPRSAPTKLDAQLKPPDDYDATELTGNCLELEPAGRRLDVVSASGEGHLHDRKLATKRRPSKMARQGRGPGSERAGPLVMLAQIMFALGGELVAVPSPRGWSALAAAADDDDDDDDEIRLAELAPGEGGGSGGGRLPTRPANNPTGSRPLAASLVTARCAAPTCQPVGLLLSRARHLLAGGPPALESR